MRLSELIAECLRLQALFESSDCDHDPEVMMNGSEWVEPLQTVELGFTTPHDASFVSAANIEYNIPKIYLT
jgi:hypothetical protein